MNLPKPNSALKFSPLKIKTLLTYTPKWLSTVSSLDKEIQEFLDHDAEETFARKSAEIVKTPTIQVLSKMLSSVPNEAGILVPICIVNRRPSLLYTVRGQHLNSHAGEISGTSLVTVDCSLGHCLCIVVKCLITGGKKDGSDKSTIEAALRETHEEISISKDCVKVFTSVGPFASTKVSVAISAVVAFIGDIDLEKLEFNHNEVAEVFTVPIADLVTEHRNRYTQFRNGWCMPVFLSKPYHIWGITANITDGVLSMITPLNYRRKFMYHGTGIQKSFVSETKNMRER